MMSFLSQSKISSSTSQAYNVEFDLHGCDCGAPDCYETTFAFDLNSENKTPKSLPITVKHTGCVEAATESDGFIKVEDATCWSYYSSNLEMNLVLKWKDDKVVDAACVIGGQVKTWDQVAEFFEKSCEEDSEIEVYRWRNSY